MSQPPGWVSVLGFIGSAAAGIWGMWCVVVAFVGGTMPIIGIQTEGSVVFGLLMFFIGEPVLMTLAYWVFTAVFMVVALPATLLASRRRRA